MVQPIPQKRRPILLRSYREMSQQEFQYHYGIYRGSGPNDPRHQNAVREILYGHVRIAFQVGKSLGFRADVLEDRVLEALYACVFKGLPRYKQTTEGTFKGFIKRVFRNAMIDRMREFDHYAPLRVPRRLTHEDADRVRSSIDYEERVQRKLEYRDRETSISHIDEVDREYLYTSLGYRLNPEEILIHMERKHNMDEQVRNAIDSLPERERDIINRRHGLNNDGIREKAKAIAVEYGVSESRISQLYTRARELIRELIELRTTTAAE